MRVPLFALALVPACLAQPAPESLLERIRLEARDRSAVVDYAFQLTDVHGHRLTGSPAFRRAAEWARRSLQGIGLENVRYQSAASADWSDPGWSYKRYAVRLVEPEFATLLSIPMPWSPPTPGRVVGEPIHFLLPGRSGL
jgi:carboxypeptidase Q